MIYKALRQIISYANETAGDSVTVLPQFSCHVLRHTFCTNLIKSGVELTSASALMGHQDIQTTANIYNDVQKEQKEKAMRQMTEYTRNLGTDQNIGNKTGI